MAIEQIDRVLRLPKGSCTQAENRVLTVLANFAQANGSNIFPGMQLLQRRTHYGERFLYIVLRRLRERGWLQVERPGGGRWKQRWRLSVPVLQDVPNPCSVSRFTHFSTAFPQSMHTPDRSISPTPDRSITAPLIDRSPKAVASTRAAAAGWPVEMGPDPSQVPSQDQPSTGRLELVDDDDAERAARMQLLEAVRPRVLAAPLATPRRRRREA